ncbi:unnamed protein product, partial [Rotaria sp. Silwood2]
MEKPFKRRDTKAIFYKYFVEFGFNEPSYSRNGTGANTHILYEKGWRCLLLDGHYENNMINLNKHDLFTNNIAWIFTENNVPKKTDYNMIYGDALTLLDPTVNCSDSLPNNFTFVFQQCAFGAPAGALRIVAESRGYTMIERVGALDFIWMRNDL